MDAKEQSLDDARPLVSVVMSVYNGEAFLQQAIDSILNQTYRHIQFIIVDDNSNPPTKKILQQITDKRVEILYNIQNLGLTKNLNASLAFCNGKYIARMDADDISLPDRIEKQVTFLEHYHHAVGTAGWIELIDENGLKKGGWEDDRNYNTAKEIKQILPQKNVIAHPTVMLRAYVMKKYGYNEQQKHSQDWDLWLRIFADGFVIEKLKEIVLQYRVHTTSVTSLHKNKSVYQKIQETYDNYLSQVITWNDFNKSVKKASQKNKIKLYFSKLKRSFIK